MNAVLFSLSVVAAVAPVPKDAKPPISCVLTPNPKPGPLDMTGMTLTITNNTTDPIAFYSTLPGGLLTFLDVELEGPDGKRISPERYDATIASPFAPPPRLVETLEANNPVKLDLWLERYVPKPEELKPGKYRVRVKLSHGERTATSEWAAWEVKSDKK